MAVLRYSRECEEDPSSMAATRWHVLAHLSSVCSPTDSETELQGDVRIEFRSLPSNKVLITGEIDREPVAPYLTAGPRMSQQSSLAIEIQRKLTDYGVPWRVLPGAPNRGNGQSWGPAVGGIMHHTATAMGKAPQVLIDGRPDLSGPLCNSAGEADGTIAFVAYHPANHAGASGGRGTAPLPVTRTFNKMVWGHEIVYPGVSPMNVAQYRSAVLLGRAITSVVGKDANWIRGHGETSITGKWDPGYSSGKMIDMGQFRRDISLATVGEGAGMSLTQKDLEAIWRFPVGNKYGTTTVWAGDLIGWSDYHSGMVRGAVDNTVIPALARIEALLKAQASVDVDEAAIVQGILASVRPMIVQAVFEAVGADNKDQADKIINALAAKLASS